MSMRDEVTKEHVNKLNALDKAGRMDMGKSLADAMTEWRPKIEAALQSVFAEADVKAASPDKLDFLGVAGDRLALIQSLMWHVADLHLTELCGFSPTVKAKLVECHIVEALATKMSHHLLLALRDAALEITKMLATEAAKNN